MSTIKWFTDINTNALSRVGGKGLSLARLTQATLPVPPGFVITTEAYRTYGDASINPQFAEAIYQAFDTLGAERVAVRSSAIAEDSPDASWAGQFESYLNVTRDNLIESVELCWKSASSEVVSDYAETQSIEKDQLVIAVVVQKMVNSEVSGVAFSVNPINKDSRQIMIEATYGLGELLVQGMVTPDNYLVDKEDLTILEKHTPHKTNMLVYQNGENTEQSVPDEKADLPCLDDSQIEELSRLIITIEDYYGTPQDIEWALEGSSFYIVQSRPITTLT